MGSLGLPATAMAVRSTFALLCFALLCGLAASSVGQSETETELTKKEGEAAGNNLLVEQALESREVRGAGSGPCSHLERNKKKKCLDRRNRKKKSLKRLKRKRTNKTKGKKDCEKGQRKNKKGECVKDCEK